MPVYLHLVLFKTMPKCTQVCGEYCAKMYKYKFQCPGDVPI